MGRHFCRGHLSLFLFAAGATLWLSACDTPAGGPDVNVVDPDGGETSSEACEQDCGDLFCHEATGQCVSCLNDDQCNSGVCHPTGNFCVVCINDADCAFGFCHPEKDYCVQCFADSHCSSAKCDLDALVCLGCGGDADCSDNNPCTADQCAGGACTHTAAVDGTECEVHKCTLGDTCQAGVCAAGSEKNPECFPCQTSAECGDDEWCDKPDGECAAEGLCAPRPGDCGVAKLTAVCACDGGDYPSACAAANLGLSVAKKGGCCPAFDCLGVTEDTDGDGCPDRCFCTADEQCGEGLLFCHRPVAACGEAPPDEGVCQPKADCTGAAGTPTLDPVCACGETFANKCDAYNAGFAEFTLGCCGADGALDACPAGHVTKTAEGCAICDCAVVGEVCGADGKTWPSECDALIAEVEVVSQGACGCKPLNCASKYGGKPVDDNGDGCADRCACTSKVDCLAGTVCAKQNTDGVCGDDKPVCAPCVTETGPMCGCNGKSYPSACDAHLAGTSIDFAGECPCVSAKDCGDGQYCENGTTCGAAGHCVACEALPIAVCSCEGETYKSGCELAASGQSLAALFGCGCKPMDCANGQVAVDSDGDTCGDTCVASCESPCDCWDQGEALTAAATHFACVLGACTSAAGAIPMDAAGCVGPAKCQSTADCGPAGYCQSAFGQCGGGKCVEKPAVCPVSVEAICGCDKQTHVGACEAAQAGTSVLSVGACCFPPVCGDTAKLADPDQDGCFDVCEECAELGCAAFEVATDTGGDVCPDSCVAIDCKTNDACKSGYCKRPLGDCDAVGQCAAVPAQCLTVPEPVCSCDGKTTFDNSCFAAQKSLNAAYLGACVTGCESSEQCADTQYCKRDVSDDGTGCSGGQGQCTALPASCLNGDEDLAIACGCDGTKYKGTCSALKEAGALGDSTMCLDECVPITCPGEAMPVDTDGDQCADKCEAAAKQCQAAADCNADQYCATPVGDCFGLGKCTAKPSSCDDAASNDPVCACDGVTYPSDCHAFQKGAQLAKTTACD